MRTLLFTLLICIAVGINAQTMPFIKVNSSTYVAHNAYGYYNQDETIFLNEPVTITFKTDSNFVDSTTFYFQVYNKLFLTTTYGELKKDGFVITFTMPSIGSSPAAVWPKVSYVQNMFRLYSSNANPMLSGTANYGNTMSLYFSDRGASTGIEVVNKEVLSIVYFDLNGRPLINPVVNEIQIKKVFYSTGEIEISKCFIVD